MTTEEKTLFDSIVDGLRRQGWSKLDAEGEALDRIERMRERDRRRAKR
jgi:hypothetical protein